ncbi:hypothetical protein MasN3_16020 [Massilia varians]|uniref:Uncharacterized protein n=1 Tax=Massilia varians TaxID=457921 RepID=A0ABM8C4H1_9BURK|nr:hypothetical protein [Massilia varians]BDT58108.1 hypothetical protein MasN3_16020 [Massilia varians]
MRKSNDDGIPGCCLGGAQDKVQAEFIDGRFVVQQSIGPLYIASRPAPPVDPKKLAEFRNEPGPPSIVDTIIAQRQEAYEGAVDAWSTDFPMHAEDNIKLLSELEDNAIRRRQQLFGRGLLLTAEQLCHRLGISNDTLSQGRSRTANVLH